jgi:prepilin-type processing-associated H-X9-DG protein
VLAALLLSAVARVQAAARRTRCLSNLRQIAAANQMYVAEFRGWHTAAFWGWSPAGAGWPANTPPAVPASGPRRHWFQVHPFARALDVPRATTGRVAADLLCPDAPLAWDRGNTSGYPIQHSYGMNRTQLPGMSLAIAPDYWNAWKTSQVRQPSEKVHVVDAVSATVNGVGSNNATLRYFRPGWGERHEAPDKTNIVAYRHGRGANVLYFDGHAQWLRDTALRYDPADATTKPNRRQWEPKTP